VGIKIDPDAESSAEAATQVLADLKTASKTFMVGTYVKIGEKEAFTKETLNFSGEVAEVPKEEPKADDTLPNGVAAMGAFAATLAAAALF
jgi:hypothetical protein